MLKINVRIVLFALLSMLGLTAAAQSDSDIDTLMKVSENAVDKVIKYNARDSVAMDLNSRQAHLYGDGSIDYDSMLLKAERIVVDFEANTLTANGLPDTAEHILGRPYFKQGEAEYHADTITFNYNTKKGIINGVITQEGEGFLHGHKVKKINDSVMYLSGGSYTTCNYAHPHFAINFTKSKLITGDKIVTGPAWLSIEDVPTPIALPFAFFPITHTRRSGVLIPSYGWMNYRGYYLKDGGYYLALGDNADLDNNLMQARGTLNKGHITIPVTATGEHLTGYNLIGNPYQSYLDFNKFANANKNLWANADTIGYKSYLIYNTRN